ncbi:hypothetical protein D3C72_1486240 [compost metagenome]
MLAVFVLGDRGPLAEHLARARVEAEPLLPFVHGGGGIGRRLAAGLVGRVDQVGPDGLDAGRRRAHGGGEVAHADRVALVLGEEGLVVPHADEEDARPVLRHAVVAGVHELVADAVAGDAPEGLEHVLPDLALGPLGGPAAADQALDVLEQEHLGAQLVDDVRHVLVEVVRRQLLARHAVRAAVADAGEALAGGAAGDEVQLALGDVHAELPLQAVGEVLEPVRREHELLHVVDVELVELRVVRATVGQVGVHGLRAQLVHEHGREPGCLQPKRQPPAAGEEVDELGRLV